MSWRRLHRIKKLLKVRRPNNRRKPPLLPRRKQRLHIRLVRRRRPVFAPQRRPARLAPNRRDRRAFRPRLVHPPHQERRKLPLRALLRHNRARTFRHACKHRSIANDRRCKMNNPHRMRPEHRRLSRISRPCTIRTTRDRSRPASATSHPNGHHNLRHPTQFKLLPAATRSRTQPPWLLRAHRLKARPELMANAPNDADRLRDCHRARPQRPRAHLSRRRYRRRLHPQRQHRYPRPQTAIAAISTLSGISVSRRRKAAAPSFVSPTV